MNDLTPEKILDLKLKANKIRELIIKMLTIAGSGHSAGPLGMADIFTAMYFHILRQDPKNPLWEDRDRLVLSNGHICPVQYATLALAGYFDISELDTLRKIDSRLQGHPHRGTLPGIETTSGPLGEGLSQAAGMALVGKMNKSDFHVYALTSDGEHEEGNTWEAMMMAAKYKLDNLTVIIDRNRIQIDGDTENVMPLDPMSDKYKAFNFEVFEIPGNDIELFIETVNNAKQVKNKPTVIIADTIPGKGVSYMENNYIWHGIPPNLQDVPGAPAKADQEKVALEELSKIEEELKHNLESRIQN